MLTPHSNLSPTQKVSLLFTSDEHGYVARQSHLQGEVAAARESNPEGTLLISCGDVFEGSAETGVLGLEASNTMLKVAGYDLMTLGNHDFDRGAEVTRDWVKNAPCPVIVSNVIDTATGEQLENTSPSKVVELNGVKVGLVGVTTQETIAILPKNKLEGLSITDPIAAVKQEVAKLKASGIQVIGLISHLGLPADHDMAKNVPDLNFILGGHTHDALEVPEYEGETLIAHPGCFRQSIGHLDLEVNAESGQVQSRDYHLIKGADRPEDTGLVGSTATGYETKVKEVMGSVIAKFPKETKYDPNVLGDQMESLVGNAILKSTGADMVMVNQKGMRAGLPAGDITVQDVFNAFPFDNRLVTTKMTVAEALSIEADSIGRQDQTSLMFTDTGLRPSVKLATRQLELLSGKKDGPSEAPISSSDLAGLAAYLDDDAIDPNSEITVATLDFLIQGGLNYFQPGHEIESDFGPARDVLTNYISDIGKK